MGSHCPQVRDLQEDQEVQPPHHQLCRPDGCQRSCCRCPDEVRCECPPGPHFCCQALCLCSPRWCQRCLHRSLHCVAQPDQQEPVRCQGALQPSLRQGLRADGCRAQPQRQDRRACCSFRCPLLQDGEEH